MKRKIDNIWSFLKELTRDVLSYLNKHKWQARVVIISLALSCIMCSLTALIITIIYLINNFL